MSSLLTTIREFLGPPDPRSERELEDDIDAEFAFHIEQIEAELIEQGVPPEHAADLARARFGNQHKLKQRCKRIALEERIMLQRINLGLMIVVLLAMTGLGVQMWVSQKSSRQTLELITTELTALRSVISDRETAAAVSPGEMPAVESRLVYLEGDVQRAGTYNMPVGTEFTVRRLLAGAGGADDGASLELVRRESWGPVRKQLGTLSELKAEPERDIILQPGDLVTVRQLQHTPEGTAPAHAEDAESRILIEGDIERPGWYPISLDEATYVHELLRRAGVRERQWVLHRPGGEGGQYELADLYLGDDPPRVVIRPGDEFQVADRRGPRTRGRFFLANAERYLFPYQWRQADENGELVEDGWRVDLSEWHILGYGRNRVAHGSLIHPNGQDVYNVRIAETSGIIEFSDERPEQISVSVTMDVESIHLETQEWRAPPRTPRDEIEQMRDQFETLFAKIGFPDKITFVRIAPE